METRLDMQGCRIACLEVAGGDSCGEEDPEAAKNDGPDEGGQDDVYEYGSTEAASLELEDLVINSDVILACAEIDYGAVVQSDGLCCKDERSVDPAPGSVGEWGGGIYFCQKPFF